MSKESFSYKLIDDMEDRINMLEHATISGIDDTFKLALGIAYMTLTKESIILKDKKNKTNRLSRLTKQVRTVDLDSLFTGPNQPKIIKTLESDKAWIIDCIRDSILHEHFDIDEENRIIKVHNTGFQRDLEAEIPFDWFFNYIEQDIYSKRFTNHLTTKGLYYNKYNDPFMHPSIENDDNNKYYDSKFSVLNHIMYSINIYGDKIPIEEIKNRINELFDYYSKQEITHEDLDVYTPLINPRDNLIPTNYMVSFLKARYLIQEQLKKEYPDFRIYINITRKKKKYQKRFNRMYKSRKYINYDELFDKMSSIFNKNDDSIIKIIERLYNFNEYRDYKCPNPEQILNYIATGREDNSKNQQYISDNMDLSKQLLCNAYYQIYGLCIQAINKKAFNNEDALNFINENIKGYSKETLRQFTVKRNVLIHSIIRLSVETDSHLKQIEHCPKDKKILYIEPYYRKLALIKQYKKELKELLDNKVVIPNTDNNSKLKDCNRLSAIVKHYYDTFMKCPPDSISNGINTRLLLRGIIFSLLDQLTEMELNNLYMESDSLKTLELIRNCFSHAGRVSTTNYPISAKGNIYLNDYDDNGNKSGVVKTNHKDLIEFLSKGLPKEKQEEIVVGKAL